MAYPQEKEPYPALVELAVDRLPVVAICPDVPLKQNRHAIKIVVLTSNKPFMTLLSLPLKHLARVRANVTANSGTR